MQKRINYCCWSQKQLQTEVSLVLVGFHENFFLVKHSAHGIHQNWIAQIWKTQRDIITSQSQLFDQGSKVPTFQNTMITKSLTSPNRLFFGQLPIICPLRTLKRTFYCQHVVESSIVSHLHLQNYSNRNHCSNTNCNSWGQHDEGEWCELNGSIPSILGWFFHLWTRQEHPAHFRLLSWVSDLP
jgi:hypothetical protein